MEKSQKELCWFGSAKWSLANIFAEFVEGPNKKPKLPEKKSVIYFWYVKPLARQCS
jgi:hypothetical protein